MINVKKLLGKRICELRKELHLSQDNLAEIVGIEPNNISKIETGKNYPSPENIAKIAKALKVEISSLFAFEHHKNFDEIKKELFEQINSDEKFARLIYKFYQVLKY